MTERQLIRTAESLADDLDAKLAAMPPRDEPTAEEWAEGFRAFVCFLVGIGGGVLACLHMGGM